MPGPVVKHLYIPDTHVNLPATYCLNMSVSWLY